jgi:hypothetical protein
MGYGIPDFAKAAELQSSSSNSIIKDEAFVKSYPNPFIDNLNIEFVINHNETIIIDLYNSTGVKILVKNFKAAPPISTIGLNNLGDLPTGIYFMKIRIGNQQIVKTLSKVK